MENCSYSLSVRCRGTKSKIQKINKEISSLESGEESKLELIERNIK